jgi:hypothetical protein
MKRWWGIRHIRYLMLRQRMTQRLARYGRHSYLVVNLEDAMFLAQVWSGDA